MPPGFSTCRPSLAHSPPMPHSRHRGHHLHGHLFADHHTEPPALPGVDPDTSQIGKPSRPLRSLFLPPLSLSVELGFALMAEKDVELFMEDGGVGGDIDDESYVGSGSKAEEDREPSLPFYSCQWPRSFRESIDTYTIVASPSFGLLGHTLSRYSSLDNGSQSGLDLNLKSHLLSESVLEKEVSDKNLKKPINLTADNVISSQVQFHGEGLISHGCSVTQTVFNGVNVLAGVGIISTPYTFREAGWIGLAFLVLFAMVCCYTGFLLKYCFENKDGILSYPDIGEAAFGRCGRLFV